MGNASYGEYKAALDKTAELEGNMGALKDEIGAMTKQLSEEQGSISVYTDRQTKALSIKASTEAELAGQVEVLKAEENSRIALAADVKAHSGSIGAVKKELTFAGDEDKKNHERMQGLIDQLQGKVKSYKKQIEEAEEIAALNLAKYRKVAGALGDAAAAADAAEQEAAMRKARARSASLV